MLILPKAV